MADFLHHTKKIITAVDEFDFKERLKPGSIMEYFQDLATIHASEIGIGYEEMKAKNMCWVLNRLSAVIDECSRIGDEIIVTTYPHKPGVVEAIRDYYITDMSGKSLIRGTSRWCVLDIGNRAIRRCAPLFNFDETVYNPDNAMENGNSQLPDLNTVTGQTSAEFRGKVRITDLDRNGHVNNARYADIMVNSCDFDYYATHNIKSFDLNFLSEMKIGNEYCVKLKTSGNETYFEADGNTKYNPIFRAKITWQ